MAWGSRLRAVGLALLLAVVAPPAVAARWIASGNVGRDVVVATPGGEVLVFNAPGQLLARRQFGAGIVAFDVSPTAPVVAVLRRGEQTILERWDYASEQVQSASHEGFDTARALCYAAGGHALFVAGTNGHEVCIISDAGLVPKRTIDVPGLDTAGDLLDICASPKDWYLAVANGEGLWFGRTEDPALHRIQTVLSGQTAPQLRFAPNGALLMAGGDAGLAMISVQGGPLRPLVPQGYRPTPAFGLSTDGALLYLADGGRLQVVRVADGGLHLSGVVRTDGGQPLGLAVTPSWGTAAVVYKDGRVVWYRPLARQTAARYPSDGDVPPGPGANPAPPNALPVLPAAGDTPAVLQKFQALAQVITSGQVFSSAKPQQLYVLDRDYARMEDLEALTAEQGWEQLVLGLAATWLRRPDLVPDPFRAMTARLAQVDLVNLRSVRLNPGVTPALLESYLGRRQATKTEHMTADGRVWEVYRFGPFGLPTDGETFPELASPTLTRGQLEAFAAGAAG